MTRVLVGDIGGTHTRLALADATATPLRLLDQARYRNDAAGGIAALIDRFLAGRDRPAVACLAVAGPTDGQRVRLTNLDWEIDTDSLARTFGFASARLINDFEAVAWGIDALAPEHLATLQAGDPVRHAPRLALGPGTGLGVAQSVWTDRGYRPLPGEGGHIAFAPVDDEQVALLRFLQARFGRVSVERLLSGPGIADLYAYCRAASGRPVKRRREPAEVTAAALDGGDPAAVWAMRLFVRILGQTAGDLALVTGSRGGIYLAGGIPPLILPWLNEADFLAGFRAKGRFSGWMETVPVHVVTDPDVGLKGAVLAT